MQNPIFELINLSEHPEKNSFLNLLFYLHKSDSQIDINEVFYNVKKVYCSSKSMIESAKRVYPNLSSFEETHITPTSAVFIVLKEYMQYELPKLQEFIRSLGIKLHYKFQATSGLGANYPKVTQYLAKSDKNLFATRDALIERIDSDVWIGSALFSKKINFSPESFEKFKFLFYEIKASIQQASERGEIARDSWAEFQKFIVKNYADYLIFHFNNLSPLTLSSSAAAERSEHFDFLVKELNFSINDCLKGEPLFFYAQTSYQIDYILKHQANFNLVNDKNKNYIEYWSQRGEGKEVLTYLNSKNSVNTDLEQVFINFLKQNKKISDLKSVMIQLSKKIKEKNKANIKIKQQSIGFLSFKYNHWSFLESFINTHLTTDAELEKLANEFNQDNYNPILYLLETKKTPHYSSDRYGQKRRNLFNKMVSNFKWQEHQSNAEFIAHLSRILIKPDAAFLSKNSYSSQEKQKGEIVTWEKYGFTKNQQFYASYAELGENYPSSQYNYVDESVKQLTSYFIDYLRPDAQAYLSILTQEFIQNNKEENKLPFKNSVGNFVFAMTLAERVFSASDKRQLVSIFIKALKQFNASHDSETQRHNNNYSFEAKSAIYLLKYFAHFNYPIIHEDLKEIKSFLAYIPLEKNSLLDQQLMAYAEKSAMQNTLSNPQISNKLTTKSKI